jgi:hypothetical protein
MITLTDRNGKGLHMMNDDYFFILSLSRNLDFSFHIDTVLLMLILFVVLAVIIFQLGRKIRLKSFEIDEAEIGIGNQKIKIRPNLTDMQTAYRIWVELHTRKIGLAVQPEEDVIVEVYDSWYSFFKVTRELVKEIPISKLSQKNTKNIISLSIEVLNSGLRPHLTAWQAKFRRWYENEKNKDGNRELSPQEIQKKYPLYDEMITSIIIVNKRMVNYGNYLKRIIQL